MAEQMITQRVAWRLYSPDAIPPSKKSDVDAGIELYLRRPGTHKFEQFQHYLIDVNVGFDLSRVDHAKLEMRSRWSPYFIVSGGVIDRGYTGPIRISLFCIKACEVTGGTAMVQMVIFGPAKTYVLEDEECNDERWGEIEAASGRKRTGGVMKLTKADGVDVEEVVCQDPALSKAVVKRAVYRVRDEAEPLFDRTADFEALRKLAEAWTGNMTQIVRLAEMFHGLPQFRLYRELKRNTGALQRSWVFKKGYNSFEWVWSGRHIAVELMRLLVGREFWGDMLGCVFSVTVVMGYGSGEEDELVNNALVWDQERAMGLSSDEKVLTEGYGAVWHRHALAEDEVPEIRMQKSREENENPPTLIDAAMNLMDRMWAPEKRLDWKTDVLLEMLTELLRGCEGGALADLMADYYWPGGCLEDVSVMAYNDAVLYRIGGTMELDRSGFGALILGERYHFKMVENKSGKVQMFVGSSGASEEEMDMMEAEYCSEAKVRGWDSRMSQIMRCQNGTKVHSLVNPALFDWLYSCEETMLAEGFCVPFFEDLLLSCGRLVTIEVKHDRNRGLWMEIVAHSAHRPPFNSPKNKAVWILLNRLMATHPNLFEIERFKKSERAELGEFHRVADLKAACGGESIKKPGKDDYLSRVEYMCEPVCYKFVVDPRRGGMGYYAELVARLTPPGELFLNRPMSLCECRLSPIRGKEDENIEVVFLYWCQYTDTSEGSDNRTVTHPGDFSMVKMMVGKGNRRYFGVKTHNCATEILANWFCLNCKCQIYKADQRWGKAVLELGEGAGNVEVMAIGVDLHDPEGPVNRFITWSNPEICRMVRTVVIIYGIHNLFLKELKNCIY